MTELVNLREMGEPHACITRKGSQRANKPPRQGRQISKLEPNAGMTKLVWLEAGLRALSGPHQNRPWVQVLRALIHGAGGIS